MLVSFVLLVMMLVSVTIVPFAMAKSPSYGFIAVVPQTAKVGDQVLITGWTSPLGLTEESRFKTGYVVTLTKPDGNTVTKTIPQSYEDASFYTTHVVDMVGQWKAVLYWPGDDDFEASTSPPYLFNVTEEQTYTPIPPIPLPTGYWTRPVPSDIHGLDAYLASWPQSDYDGGNRRYNPYSKAPNTAHILWTTPAWPSGIIGGEFENRGGSDPYAVGMTNGIPILHGKAYYTYLGLTQCIDMYTGEIEWQKEFDGSLTFGYLPDFARIDSGEIFDSRGIYPVIFVRPNGVSGRVDIYNAATGQPHAGTWIGGGSSVTDSRVGITRYHEGYVYYIANGYITKWDPTVPGANLNVSSSFSSMQYTPKLTYRVQIPEGVPAPSLFWEDIGVSNGCTAAFNLTTGEVMYSGKNYFITADGTNVSRTEPSSFWEGDNTVAWGIYTDCFQPDLRNYGFNITTGELAWYTEPREYPYGTFNSYSNGAGDHKFYVLSYDGHVWAYEAETGKTAWKFYSGYAGTDKPFGTWPFWTAPASADGKVYASTGEHSQTNPRAKGDRLFAINDTDGTEIWSITGMYGGKSIGDNKLLTVSGSTGLLYCFGKGPTAVTISTMQNFIPKGTGVLITGTVTDQSPAQKGAAVVSDDSMTAWMEYLHMMRPKPTNVTGVTVKLTATGPDGTTVDIGSTTSTVDGQYAFAWTPSDEGLYWIKASFEGTESYFSSEASTAINVGPAAASPTQTVSPTDSVPTSSPSAVPGPESPAGTEVYIAIAAVVIIAAVIAAALILRRRSK